MFERAIAEFQKTRTLSPASTFATAGLGHAYGMAGNRAEAVQILRELIEQSKKGYVPAFDVAVVYEGIGDDEHAFEWLEKAYAERSSWLVYLKQDPTGMSVDPMLAHRSRAVFALSSNEYAEMKSVTKLGVMMTELLRHRPEILRTSSHVTAHPRGSALDARPSNPVSLKSGVVHSRETHDFSLLQTDG